MHALTLMMDRGKGGDREGRREGGREGGRAAAAAAAALLTGKHIWTCRDSPNQQLGQSIVGPSWPT